MVDNRPKTGIEGENVMGFEEIRMLLENYNRSGQLPTFLMGVIAALVVSFGGLRIYRLVNGPDARLSWLKKQIEDLIKERDELETRCGDLDSAVLAQAGHNRELIGKCEALSSTIVQLSGQCERLKEDEIETRDRAKRIAKRAKDAESQVASLTQQLNLITNSDGKTWEREARGHVASFHQLSMRRTPIVSVINLKGGVGKTTITANLGAALGVKGYRVLMIDLDHQGSLSGLCLNYQEIDDIRKSGRSARDLFRDGDDGVEGLARCTTRLSDFEGDVYMVPADEGLADAEMQLMERWISGTTLDDVRYRLRNVLHNSDIREQYDVILIDCPPRLTTAGINALTCSDYVLTPVLLDQTSTLAVPRLFQWLRKLRPTTCPDLSVLGLVGNRAYSRRKTMISREKAVWVQLGIESQDRWGENVRQFQTYIREHNAGEHRIAALDSKYKARYQELAEEFISELPTHARRRPSGLPPLAQPTLGSVGG